MSDDEAIQEDKAREFMEHVFRCAELGARVKAMDDRELLWWMKRSGYLDGLAFGSVAEAAWDEIENRLYPEYDGEAVRITDTGWSTPAGPVEYVTPETAATLRP